MDQFQEELSRAQGQRNDTWHQERLTRFTSSRGHELFSEGRAGTITLRKKLDKQRNEGSITSEAYDESMKEVLKMEYDAKFGDACRTYVYEKIAEMVNMSPHLSGGAASTEWGNENEHNAIKVYEALKGVEVEQMGFVAFNEFFGGSPDGKIKGKDENGQTGIIEVKCPYNPANHIRVMVTNEVPVKYLPQCYGNILATGADYCDFISYDPRCQIEGLEIHVIRVLRDEKRMLEFKKRIQEVRRFLEEQIGVLEKSKNVVILQDEEGGH